MEKTLMDYYNSNQRGSRNTASPAAVSTGTKQNTNAGKKTLSDYWAESGQKKRTTYADAVQNTQGIYARAAEETRLDAGEGMRYTGRMLLGGAATGMKNIANDLSYKAQMSIPEQIAENAYWEAVYQGKDPQKAYDEAFAKAKEEHESYTYKKAVDWGEKYNQQTYDKYGEVGGGWGVAGDLAQTVGNMAPVIAAGFVPVVGGALSKAALFSSASGAGIEEALNEGADIKRAVNYGTAEGAKELGTEMLSGGVMRIFGKGAADDALEMLVSKAAGSNTGRTALRVLGNMHMEGREEFLSDLLEPLAKTIYNGKTVRESYRDLDMGEALYDYLLGALSGGVFESAGVVTGKHRTANEVLRDKAVEEAIGRYSQSVKEKGLLNKESRAAYNEAADTMEQARTEQNRTRAVENETRRIMRRTGMDEEYARALAERRYGGQEAVDTEEGKTAGRASVEVENRLERAVEMLREGKTNSQVYYETGLVVSSGYNITNDFGGELLMDGDEVKRRIQQDGKGQSQGEDDRDTAGILPGDRRAKNQGGNSGLSGGVLQERIGGVQPEGKRWNQLTTREQKRKQRAIKKYENAIPGGNFNALVSSLRSKGVDPYAWLAEKVYSDAQISSIVAESNWAYYFTDMEGLLAELNEGGESNGKALLDAGQENGTDGDGAGGQDGVFSKAAGEPGAGERGDAGENGAGLGAGAEAVVREVTPAELGVSNGSREKTIQVVDADRAGGSVQAAAEEVRSIGMEPVAYRGEMIVGDAPVWGYIENGKIYFRVDAADRRGNAIDAGKIVKHEMFHAAAEGDPELVESVKSAVTERMSAEEFEGMKRAYMDAYSRVQDFSGWTEQEIADYLMQEITADAYAGLNYFSKSGEITEAARAAAPQVGQAQTAQSVQGTRGPPMGRAQTFVGYDDETGRGIYQSNFPEGTPKREKGKHIIELIQKVWSKQPIELVIRNDDGSTRTIKAQYDPTYDESENIPTDASKIAGGNRHGTAKDQRVTLNLADDYYQILSDATYNRSKEETGKETGPHQGVREWHYFINEIFYIEANGTEKVPYTVTIDVKEKDNGSFVYSYHAEINKEQTAPQTLHAAVNNSEKGAADGMPTNTVQQTEAESKGNLPRASVEVDPERQTETDTPPEERKLVRDRTVTLNRGGKKVEIEIRKSSRGWLFSVKAVGEKPVYDETLYDTPQEAARAALQAGEEYTMPEEERTRKALYEAADEATEAGTTEEAPPRGRYSQKEMELEEDRKRTLAEDAPWGAGARPVSEDADGNAAAEEFAQERAERAAEEDMAKAMEDFNKLLEDQLPVRDKAKPEEKVSSEVKKETEPRRKRWRDRWRSLVRTVVNAGDTIHRIARETGEKALDGYYFRALAARQTGTEWIAGKRHDILGRVTGKGLNEIFDPIRAKGKDYYEQFQLYLYHMHNIDRMSRDYEQYVREAQAEVDRLLRIEPGLGRLSEKQLDQIAKGYTMDAPLAKDYMDALRKRKQAENRTNKPVFGSDVTAEDSRAAVERLLEKHPEFTELAKDVYEYSDALLQYRVDAGLIKQEDMDRLKKVYPHYVPTFRAQTNEQTKILHKGGLQVSKAIGRAVGGDGVLLPLHTALARQTMTVTKNGGINRLGMALLKARDEHGSVMKEYITDVQEAENTFSEDLFDELEAMEPRKENVITVIEDGKRYDMTLDEGMTEAFKAFEPDKNANKAAYKFSKGMVDLFKKLCTAYNPLFSVRNMIRDIQDAGLYSVDAKRWAANYPKAYKEILKNGKYWQQYVGLGGNYASVFDYAAGEARLDQKGLIGTIEKVNRWIEAAPRLAEFMTVIQKAEARGEVTEADLMTAFEAAQDVTTNFGRAGTKVKMLNKYFVPFLNPSIQGADKFIRNMTERKGFKQWAQLVIRAAALGIAPAVINGLLHREDEDWEKEWADISDATKANYYLFKLRDGVWLKIPKGRALAVLSTVGVALSETVKGNDIDPTELLEVISTNIAPQNPVEANIFKAWFDADLFNKDSRGKTWYGGTIENERMQNYRPGERYDSSTDKISKWLGGVLNLSPAKINYMLDQYSGVIGDMVLPLLTPQAESNPVLKAFTVDTVTQNKTSGEYYDALDEMKWDMNGGDIAAGETYRYMNHASQTVSEYYAQIREIEADPELSDREKKEMTRTLKSALTQYQKEILETAEKYRLAAEDYFDDHPELDYENERAVRAYMEQYNAMQEDEQYKKTESQIAAMMEAIVYREVNREVLGAEYALETYGQSVYEKAQEANRSAGVSYDDYYDFYFRTKDMHADRDENGKSISGTKKAKVLGFIAGMDISDEQKDALAIAAGYKAGSWKSYTDGKTGGSGGRGGRSSKQKAVKIKETKVKLPDISSARANTIATRSWTGDETSAYEAIRKLTSGMRKKNPWYALPTGDPEIDEERPASARYFQTGTW